jgi:hypothetical protein
MKIKNVWIIALAALICFSLPSCKKEKHNGINNTVDDGAFAVPQIGIATDELIKKFNAWLFEYNDDSGDRIVLWTDIVRKDFEFISLGYEDSLFVEDIIYSFNEWPPQEAIHLQINVSEGIPTFGISFLDNNNIKRYYYIGKSGIDGALSLNEFFNSEKGNRPVNTEETLQFVYTVEFNNRKIPITVNYSHEDGGEYYVIDSSPSSPTMLDCCTHSPFCSFRFTRIYNSKPSS